MRLLLLPYIIYAFLPYLVKCNETKRYDGYSVLEVFINSTENLQLFRQLQENFTFDVWREPCNLNYCMDGDWAHVMMNETTREVVGSVFETAGIRTKNYVANVQSLIDGLNSDTQSRRSAIKTYHRSKSFLLDEFHRTTEIYSWMQKLASTHSSFVSVIDIGKSFEGKEMKLIKIGRQDANRVSKCGFWIDAGIHAREWITVSTATWIINQLVTQYASNDSSIRKLVDGIDFYILPVFNIDGYEHTFTDRLWRKTRSGPYCTGPGNSTCCTGVDANRNWDYHWNESGSSDDPCSSNFAGLYAFSEPELRNVVKFLTQTRNMSVYFDLHSYGEMWFFPYAYKANTYTNDRNEMIKLSKRAVDAIAQVHGTSYNYGTPGDILYSASGSSFDYTKAVTKIKWSFGLELRPGHDDGHKYGFILPPKFIIPTAQETWAGLKVVAEHVINITDDNSCTKHNSSSSLVLCLFLCHFVLQLLHIS